MKHLYLGLAAVLASAILTTTHASAANVGKVNPSVSNASMLNPRPPETYQGQWYTTPAKCSYSRAQAPGYPVHWVLIINPHHIGQPNAHRKCPPRL